MTDIQLLAAYRSFFQAWQRCESNQLLAAYRAFFQAWQRCESNRGCYSCCASHDARCGLSCQDDEAITCSCGRAEIERIAREITLNESPL